MEIIATRHGLARIDADGVAVVDLPYADLAELLADGGSLADVATAPVVRRLSAEDLDEMNENIVGQIEVVAEYR